jgi:hypothetical protein
MNAHSPLTDMPLVGRAARDRRRLAASLLVGWFAFWITTVIAPCCETLTSMAQASHEPAVLQQSDDDPGGGDHRNATCPDLTGVQPAPPALHAVTPDLTPRVSAVPPYAAGRFDPYAFEAPTRSLSGQPPAPLPFHLRTARLLI